ncbi:MAG: isochorismatase family protein [Pigmentiphaga sp.]
MQEALQIDDPTFRDRGFGQRFGFGKHCALVVVDLIQSFTDPNSPLGSDLDAVVAATNQLIGQFRKIKAPIYFFTASYRPDLGDAGVWQLKMGGMSTLVAGSDGVKIDARLDRRESDYLIVKKYASCFAGTDFSAQLVSLGVDTLVVTGCTTSGCIRATVVDAVSSGFRPIVVPEAVGDRSVPAHQQSLLDIDAKYGDVVDMDEALARLSRYATEQSGGAA